MKSCLKCPSIPGSPAPEHSSLGRKCVVFGEEGSEEVHWADEWDRTPTEPARKLSYQELLELKEIQRSLPHAPQPPDLRPGKQLLSTVPIGLLPLAAESPTSPVSPASPPQSPGAYQTPFLMPPGRAKPPPAPTRFASSSLTHLRPPTAPPAPRARPAFAFLPLLAAESPAASPAPSTASSAASSADNSRSGSPLDAHAHYPPARAAADGEPDRVLPLASRPRAIQATGSRSGAGFGYEHAYRAAEAAAYSPPFGSSAYDYKRDRHEMLPASISRVASLSGSQGAAAPPMRKKKKSYMVINDVMVEIEEDEEEEESAPLSLTPSLPPAEPAPILPPISLPPPVLSLPVLALGVAEKSTPPPPSSQGSSAEKEKRSAFEGTSAHAQPQTSPRLAVRPLSPLSPRHRDASGSSSTPNSTPSSNSSSGGAAATTGRPTTPTPTGTQAQAQAQAQSPGRRSPVQARASSRLVRA
ncbi:hypothetical protein B0H11DRAFT_685392 [Mycena galericulata]|nr:hypothetical protein B0H11DRAFT_685392 [Mycena galericulata]